MLPDATLPVPASFMALLSSFGPLFTAPSFRTFCGLACGFLAQTGKRTVCETPTGAGLSRLWSHDRAHRFFSRARWDPDELGLAVARIVVRLLVPDGEPVLVAVDDTLLRRRGKKVWAASWFHDGSAQGAVKTGYGNNWVVAAIIVRLPVVARPVAVPVMAKLVIKGTTSSSRLWLARRMVQAPAGALPGRAVRVAADSAYAGGEAEVPARRGDLDYPAAQGRRPLRPAPGAQREAGPARAKGGPLAAGQARRHDDVRSGHRHPLRQAGHDPGRGRHLPVVLRLRLPARHRRAGAGQVRRRSLSSSPGRPSPSSGTPPQATTPPTSRTAAPAHPATPPRPSPPQPT